MGGWYLPMNDLWREDSELTWLPVFERPALQKSLRLIDSLEAILI